MYVVNPTQKNFCAFFGGTMKYDYESLSGVSLFDGLNIADMDRLFDCIKPAVRSYKKGSIIIGEGDAAKSIGIVLSGEVMLVKEDYFGNRSIISTVSAPNIFAEAFACAGVEEMPLSVIASDNCKIMFIDCIRLNTMCQKTCENHKKIIYNLLGVVSEKNIALNEKIEFLSKRTTREKLLAYLYSCALKSGSRTFTIPFDRQELADFLCVERSAMSAVISRLREENIIKSDKNRFTIVGG